jgi:hypothetical protein
MTEGHKAKFTPGCLPENHFAILFEGAWIFTPDPNSDGILAVCPLADDGMHAFEFGMWKDDALSPLQPFSTCFPNGAQFELTIDPDQIRCGGDSFHSIFDEAGRKYPFVYLSSTERRGKQSTKFRLRDDVKAKSRTVSIPLPTSVRAAGALISAEVRGPGTQELFGGVVSAKRTFVTFLFLYEYDDELDAVVEMEGGDPKCGEIHADQNQHPHLIFRVRPAKMDGPDPCAMLERRTVMPSPPEESADKVHAIMVFDQLRTSLVNNHRDQNSTANTCCDILVYHDPGKMILDCGDTGLGGDELGLGDQCPGPVTHGRTLPACAGGGIVSG